MLWNASDYIERAREVLNAQPNIHSLNLLLTPPLPPSLLPSLPPNSIRGIMLWNASDYLERAREVINAQPNIHNVDMLKRQIALAPDAWLRVMETSAD